MRNIRSKIFFPLIFSLTVCLSQVFVESVELNQYDGNSYEAAEYILLKPGFEFNASLSGTFEAKLVKKIPVNFDFRALKNDPITNSNRIFIIDWEELWHDDLYETGYEIEVSKDPSFSTVDFSYNETDAAVWGDGIEKYSYTISESNACRAVYYARMRVFFTDDNKIKHSRWIYDQGSAVPSPIWDLSFIDVNNTTHLKINWAEGYSAQGTHFYVSTTEDFTNIVHTYSPAYYDPFYTSFEVQPNTTYYIKLQTSFCYGITHTYYDQITYTLPNSRVDNAEADIILGEKLDVELEVSPNPTDGRFRINASNLDDSKITLLSLDGKVIPLENAQKNIDISIYPSGIYILKIETKDFNKSIRLIKK